MEMIILFIGRKQELASLNSLHQSGRFEFVVIYGRRRVGKTALITEFAQNKKAIYFTGVENSAKQNLENLSKSILEFSSGIEFETSFLSFQAAVEYVFKLAEHERIILAIDEYPYVARAESSFASTLQLLIDKHKSTSHLMLILCGSSISYMEDHVLAYKAPLYGRKTSQLKVFPLGFEETCKYFANYAPEDKALMYGVVGGTPQYLLQMNSELSVEQNIKKTFFNAASALFEEPENLLKQEVREPAMYNAIVTAIASGASRLSDISNRVGENTSSCSTYIKNLLSLGILKKETPYGETSSKKTIYSIEDNMFRFWYRFVPQNASIIARGGADLVYKRIEPYLSEYMGSVFEDICKQYLWKLLLKGRSPIEFASLGRWWGNDPFERKQAEIDMIGEQDKNTLLLGECKWKNEKTDTGVLDVLVKRSRIFSHANKHLYLFSKSGFTKGCMDSAAHLENVTLVTYSEMLEEFERE